MLNVTPRRPRQNASIPTQQEFQLNIPPTDAQYFGALQGENFTNVLERNLARAQYDPSASPARRAAADFYRSTAGVLPQNYPLESPTLSAEELNTKYALPEQFGPLFTEAMPESLARETYAQRVAEIQREGILARGGADRGFWNKLGLGLLSFATDPVQAATMLVPGAGAGKTVSFLGRLGLGARAASVGGYAVEGAVAGAAGESLLVLAQMGISSDNIDNLSLRETIERVFYGGVFGAAFNAPLGLVAPIRPAPAIPTNANFNFAPRPSIEERLTSQIESLGLPSDQASAGAQIYSAFFNNLASRLGIPVETILERSGLDPLQFERGGPLSSDALQQPAYHGSPYRFGQFSLNKVGTGEGNQSFGWGLYFSQTQEIAETYRNTLTRARTGNIPVTIFDTQGRQIEIPSAIRHYFKDYDRDLTDAAFLRQQELYIEQKLIPQVRKQLSANQISKESADELLSQLNRDKNFFQDLIEKQVKITPAGGLYEVNIPENNELMDWDTSIVLQSKNIQTAVESLQNQVEELFSSTKTVDTSNKSPLQWVAGEEAGPSGGTVYNNMVESLKQIIDQNPTDKGLIDFLGFVPKIRYSTRELDFIAQRAISLRLLESGIKGHSYYDGFSRLNLQKGEKTRNFVIYDDSSVNILSLFQDARGAITFAPTKTLIQLFETGDISSIIHEGGHLFLETFTRLAKVYPALKDDLKLLEDTLGFKESPTRAAHEAFATQLESYLKDGIAPNEKLRNLFAQFKQWLTDIYRRLRSQLPSVSPELRTFFDQMLSEEAPRPNQQTVYETNSKVIAEISDLPPLTAHADGTVSNGESPEEMAIVEREFNAAERSDPNLEAVAGTAEATASATTGRPQTASGEASPSAAKPITVSSFKTKGETGPGTEYSFFGNFTIRHDKGRGDQVSERTVYISPEEAKIIRPIKLRKGIQSTFNELPDGRWGVTIQSGEAAGQTPQETIVVPTFEPAVGRVPVGLTEGGRIAMIGTPIVEMKEAVPAHDPLMETLEQSLLDANLSPDDLNEIAQVNLAYQNAASNLPRAFAQAAACLVGSGL